jgi:exodeoxyribonuclease V
VEKPLYAEIVVVDEASMVPDWIGAELMRRDVRVLAIGDPHQLLPMTEPWLGPGRADAHLDTIVRQAEGSPIIQLATAIREGRPRPTGLDPKVVAVLDRLPLGRLLAPIRDGRVQIIAWRNETVDMMNAEVRRRLGYSPDTPPQPGERMMVNRNTRWGEWLNGEQVVVDHTKGERVAFRADGRSGRLPPNMLSYAYAITCHKAQGSR